MLYSEAALTFRLMSITPNGLSTVTQGLVQTSAVPSFASVIGSGLPVSANTAPPPNATETAYPLSNLVPLPDSPVTTQNLQALQNASVVYDSQGRPTQAYPNASIDLGNGSVLSFNPATLDAVVTPAFNTANSIYDDAGETVFTASDCRVMIELPQNPVFNGSSIASRMGKQLIEITTLSISTHRSKSPARAFGYINPRGFANGSRTIAGTMVLSKSTSEILYKFLQSGLMADLSKDTIYNKIDQLPPFDFTILFSNEYGYMSSQRLLGVSFVTDGTVISIQDMLLEQQITWVASDFTALTPVTFNTMFSVNTSPSNAIATQQTVGSVLANQNSNGNLNNISPLGTTNTGSGVVPNSPLIGSL